jgi:hypothetical protein
MTSSIPSGSIGLTSSQTRPPFVGAGVSNALSDSFLAVVEPLLAPEGRTRTKEETHKLERAVILLRGAFAQLNGKDCPVAFGRFVDDSPGLARTKSTAKNAFAAARSLAGFILASREGHVPHRVTLCRALLDASVLAVETPASFGSALTAFDTVLDQLLATGQYGKAASAFSVAERLQASQTHADATAIADARLVLDGHFPGRVEDDAVAALQTLRNSPGSVSILGVGGGPDRVVTNPSIVALDLDPNFLETSITDDSLAFSFFGAGLPSIAADREVGKRDDAGTFSVDVLELRGRTEGEYPRKRLRPTSTHPLHHTPQRMYEDLYPIDYGDPWNVLACLMAKVDLGNFPLARHLGVLAKSPPSIRSEYCEAWDTIVALQADARETLLADSEGSKDMPIVGLGNQIHALGTLAKSAIRRCPISADLLCQFAHVVDYLVSAFVRELANEFGRPFSCRVSSALGKGDDELHQAGIFVDDPCVIGDDTQLSLVMLPEPEEHDSKGVCFCELAVGGQPKRSFGIFGPAALANHLTQSKAQFKVRIDLRFATYPDH